MDPQPRKYRIRVFEKNYEVHTDRQYVAVLDFSSGPGLRATEGQLDALVQALAYAAGARGSKTLDYRLVIQDWVTGDRLYDWPAKTWVDPH